MKFVTIRPKLSVNLDFIYMITNYLEILLFSITMNAEHAPNRYVLLNRISLIKNKNEFIRNERHRHLISYNVMTVANFIPRTSPNTMHRIQIRLPLFNEFPAGTKLMSDFNKDGFFVQNPRSRNNNLKLC